MNAIIVLLQIFATTTAKAILLAIMILIAHKWANGNYDNELKQLRKLKKEYGIITIILVIVWWLLTPTGTPDDYITVWLIASLGLVPYIIIQGLITLYLIWRLRVTIVIYK